MKSIDFSKPGGFPLTQDQLGYMQSAYTEALTALASVGGAGPLAITGVEVSRALVSGTTYNYVVTAGWTLYNGEMLRVSADTITVDTSTMSACILINRTNAPLTYNDGSTHSVVCEVTCSLSTITTGAPDTADYFALASLRKYGRETDLNTLAVSTDPADGGVTGSVFYRKNFLNNTLQMTALLACANAQNFASMSSIQSYLLGVLPEGYRPKSTVYFTGRLVSVYRLKDDLDVAWADFATCTFSVNGSLATKFIKPQISVPSYAFAFNVLVPLD